MNQKMLLDKLTVATNNLCVAVRETAAGAMSGNLLLEVVASTESLVERIASERDK